MGTVFNRGTKDKPNWYVGYRESGRWIYKPSRRSTKAQAKRWVQEIESRIARGQVGIEDDEDAPAFKPAFDSFLDGLTNRNADDDRSRGRRHLLPKFGRMKLASVALANVMEWIDEQRAAGELSEASIRHNLNLMSRFFSWAIARGKATINPIRQIPMGSRPTQTVKSDTPWLKKKKDKIANEVKPTMTWYQATRHSFVSRHLSRGASLDEVSAAVGHSSPVVTKRFYDHYVRRTFSPKLRAGLGLGAKREGRVVPMRKSR